MKYVIDLEALPVHEQGTLKGLIESKAVVMIYGRSVFIEPYSTSIQKEKADWYNAGQTDGYNSGHDKGYSEGFDDALSQEKAALL